MVVEYKQQVLSEQSTTKEIVERILEVDEEARNNDNYLILRYWRETTGRENFAPINFMRHFDIGATNAETIVRVRRVIQNTEGRLLPTDFEVARKRRIKESIMREYYGSKA